MVLFRLPTGLAVGLALKEQRYTTLRRRLAPGLPAIGSPVPRSGGRALGFWAAGIVAGALRRILRGIFLGADLPRTGGNFYPGGWDAPGWGGPRGGLCPPPPRRRPRPPGRSSPGAGPR